MRSLNQDRQSRQSSEIVLPSPIGSISLEKKESSIKLTVPIPFFGGLEFEHELRNP